MLVKYAANVEMLLLCSDVYIGRRAQSAKCKKSSKNARHNKLLHRRQGGRLPTNPPPRISAPLPPPPGAAIDIPYSVVCIWSCLCMVLGPAYIHRGFGG